MDVYGINQKEKSESTSGRTYYGVSVNDTDPWSAAFEEDFYVIADKFGFRGSKKMVLLAAVKVAAAAIREGFTSEE